MGYRLDVAQLKTGIEFYGTKLYGYTDYEKLKSYKYLVDNGIWERGYRSFGDGNDNFTVMRVYQFREFAKLYNEDMNEYYKDDKDEFINDNTIQTLMNLDSFDFIIISWG